MIYTRLPYSFEQMEEISTSGAVVDMSALEFPGIAIENQQRTALIFLRNTGFKVKLDFERCSYEEKVLFAKLFIMSGIECSNPEFSYTWLTILNRYIIDKNAENCSIFTEAELERFIEAEQDLIDKVVTVIYSLPVFLLERINIGETEYVDDIEVSTDTTVSNNICYLLNGVEWLDIFLNADAEKYKQYRFEHLFNMENNKLFDAIKLSPLAAILVGANTTDEAVWGDFINELFGLTDEEETR